MPNGVETIMVGVAGKALKLMSRIDRVVDRVATWLTTSSPAICSVRTAAPEPPRSWVMSKSRSASSTEQPHPGARAEIEPASVAVIALAGMGRDARGDIAVAEVRVVAVASHRALG